MGPKILPFGTYHPEIIEGEIYLGNFTTEGAKLIEWKTKVSGCHSYTRDGARLPEEFGYRPYFAELNELKKSGAI